MGVRAAVILTLVALLLAVRSIAAQAPVPRIWQGVYTDEQAARGKATFDTACIRSHGSDLAGTTAPA
jgi:hypothetical protein